MAFFLEFSLFYSADRAFTHARFGLLVQSVQSGGACEHAGMQQGDVIIGVGSSLLDSTMSCVLHINPPFSSGSIVESRMLTRGRYDHCLSLIKSACKKADEDYDDPFIVLPCAFPLKLYFDFIAGSHRFSSPRSSAFCFDFKHCCCHKRQQRFCAFYALCPPVLSPLSARCVTPSFSHPLGACRYTVMQNLEAQFTHAIAVARCYQDTTTPVVPGFVPAGAMLPLPRYVQDLSVHISIDSA